MLVAKKVKFPLEMDGGVEVRDIVSLRQNFSLKRVMGYLANGKLVTWLRDRYANDLADAIEELDKNEASLAKRICGILGVDFDEDAEETFKKAEERNRKLARLKAVSSEKEYIDNIDYVAFEQEDLYNLLDEGAEKIYLCGEVFSIPLVIEDISYVGINSPVVLIDSKVEVDWEKKNITLSGVKYDDNYQKVVESAVTSYRRYVTNSYISFMLTAVEKKESEKSFCLLAKEMRTLKYDIDNDIQRTKKMLIELKIVNLAESYLKNL